MIFCFRRSRLSLILSAIVIATLVIAVILHYRGRPGYALVLSVALSILIGSFTAILVANSVATSENQRLLSILHVELEPEQFLREYAVVPGRAFDGPSKVLAFVNLADGYAAAGDFLTAQDVLLMPDHKCTEKDRLSLSCLVVSSRCRYIILSGDIAKAEVCMNELENAISNVVHINPALAENMKYRMSLWRIMLNDVEDKDVSIDHVSREILKSGYKIMRLELQLVLAHQQERSGDMDSANSTYRTMSRDVGGLYLAERITNHSVPT